MVARVARSRFPSQQHREASERNGGERVGPSLARAPGFHALDVGRTGELEGLSISLFESREANEAVGAGPSTPPAQASGARRRRSSSRRSRLPGRPSPRTILISGPGTRTTGGLWST